MALELDIAGLWLFGLGAVLLLGERMIGHPRPRLGLTLPSATTSFTDRLHFSLEATGLLLSAVGSALFVAAHVPPMWFIVATLVVVIASVYGLLAWLALKYWRLRLGDSMRSLSGDLRNPLVQWQVDCLRICASWRWVLRHPFERDDWPTSCQKVLGPVPPGIPTQSQEVTAERLRRLEEGVSLADQHWLLAEPHQRGLPIRSDIRGLHPANAWRTRDDANDGDSEGAD